MRPSGDESACWASTRAWTCANRSGLRHEELSPLVRAHDLDRGEARDAPETRELLVRVEMAARRKRVRRRFGSLRLGRRREDREPSARRVQDASHLAERPDRVGEEEERNEGGNGGERAVRERQLVH